MAGLPHLQGRFGARQHGHLSNSWRISDQDLCPPAPKTLEIATKSNDDIHHCSFQCPYLALISSNKHGGQLGWTGWAAIIFLSSHHLYLLLVIFFVRSWKFYAIFVMLVIACLCCMPYELCLLIVIVLVVWSVLENQINWQRIYSFVTSIATSVLRIGHISLDCLSIFSLAKRCNSKTI